MDWTGHCSVSHVSDQTSSTAQSALNQSPVEGDKHRVTLLCSDLLFHTHWSAWSLCEWVWCVSVSVTVNRLCSHLWIDGENILQHHTLMTSLTYLYSKYKQIWVLIWLYQWLFLQWIFSKCFFCTREFRNSCTEIWTVTVSAPWIWCVLQWGAADFSGAWLRIHEAVNVGPEISQIYFYILI